MFNLDKFDVVSINCFISVVDRKYFTTFARS